MVHGISQLGLFDCIDESWMKGYILDHPDEIIIGKRKWMNEMNEMKWMKFTSKMNP